LETNMIFFFQFPSSNVAVAILSVPENLDFASFFSLIFKSQFGNKYYFFYYFQV
jgi:hypothetical protein